LLHRSLSVPELLQVFAGVPPFANTVDSYLFTVVVDRKLRPPRPTEPQIVGYGLTDLMWAVVEECWSQDPVKRPLVAVVISQLALQKPTSHRTASPIASPERPNNRHRPLPPLSPKEDAPAELPMVVPAANTRVASEAGSNETLDSPQDVRSMGAQQSTSNLRNSFTLVLARGNAERKFRNNTYPRYGKRHLHLPVNC
jgi:hypothetical protein